MSLPKVALTPEIELMLSRNAVVAVGVSGGLSGVRDCDQRAPGQDWPHRAAPAGSCRPRHCRMASKPREVPGAGHRPWLGASDR